MRRGTAEFIGLTVMPVDRVSTPVHDTGVIPARSIGAAVVAGAPAEAAETSAVATESPTGRQRRHGERSRH